MLSELDTEIVQKALVRAGVEIQKIDNRRANLGIRAEHALALAIKEEIALAYESARARRTREWEAMKDLLAGPTWISMKDVRDLTGCYDPRLSITPKDSLRPGVTPINKIRSLEIMYGDTKVDPKLAESLRAACASDCATHNEPAMPNGPCDCGVEDHAGKEAERKRVAASIATVMGWKD